MWYNVACGVGRNPVDSSVKITASSLPAAPRNSYRVNAPIEPRRRIAGEVSAPQPPAPSVVSGRAGVPPWGVSRLGDFEFSGIQWVRHFGSVDGKAGPRAAIDRSTGATDKITIDTTPRRRKTGGCLPSESRFSGRVHVRTPIRHTGRPEEFRNLSWGGRGPAPSRLRADTSPPQPPPNGCLSVRRDAISWRGRPYVRPARWA